MKLVEAVIREITIPFKAQFKHALATRRQTSTIIFEIVTADGIHGYGEGTPRTYVTGETIPATREVLQRMAEKMDRLAWDPAESVIDNLARWERHLGSDIVAAPSARCAMELALLDACGQIGEKSVLDLLGPRQTTAIRYSGVISESERDETVKTLAALQAFGFKQVKIKAGRDFSVDRKRLTIIRSHLDDDIELRVDANGAWELDEAVQRIKFYNDNGIHIFEQPIPADGKADYPRLLQRIGSQNIILLDESVCSVDDALWFIRHRGAGGFNLKVSKHGGLINSLAIYRLAIDNGLACQLGCHVGETSILTAAGMILAGLVPGLLACEGAFGDWLLARDIVKRPLQFGRRGMVDLQNLQKTPGLGIQIDPELLESASVHTVRRSY